MMFGNKKRKQAKLDAIVALLRSKGEATQAELSVLLQVSPDAIEDYLSTLHEQNVKLCQKGRKISLLEHWYGNEDG
jgi:Mn-dependent DtxR family transcriptional regulator